MNILLTGNKGFVGSHLEPKLKELGHEVVGFDIETSQVQDIRNTLSLNSLFNNNEFDVIVHLAALTGVRDGENDAKSYIDTNVTGTRNLLERAEGYKVKKFLFASSSSIYGERDGACEESQANENVNSVYAFTKVAGENLCKMMKNVQTLIFRPFTVYGENGREEMVIPKIIKAGQEGTVFEKYGDGGSTRGYTHIDDLCEGIVALLDYETEEKRAIFNLGGIEVISLNNLIEIVKKQFPKLKVKQVVRNPADVEYSYADISKAKDLLGWAPKRKFKGEIKKLCQEKKKS